MPLGLPGQSGFTPFLISDRAGLRLRNVSGARIAGNSKLRVDSDASVRGLVRE